MNKNSRLFINGKYNNDCEVFTTNIESEAVSLIQDIVDNPCFEGVPIRIMPDVHAGKGIVIGFTAPLTKMINPNYVGVDIGCRISFCRFNSKVNEGDFERIERMIRKEIPFGTNINNSMRFEMKDFIRFMRNGYNSLMNSWDGMIDNIDISEDFFSKMCQRLHISEKVFYNSIGTVGGGNHFIEIGRDKDNCYTLAVHCGSRNFGLKVCNYWDKISHHNGIDKKKFRAIVENIRNNTENKSEIPILIEEAKNNLERSSTPSGFLMGEDMHGYMSDMAIAQLYAEYNHKVIINIISEIFKTINGGTIIDSFASTHNYIDYEDHMIRKGAIRSHYGEKMVIPFNMRDGIAICVGNGNSDWNKSAPHGCGRLYSRTEARRRLSMTDFKNQMKDVFSTSVCESTIDEAPDAYKSMDEILRLIEPTCMVEEMIPPIINIKAKD